MVVLGWTGAATAAAAAAAFLSSKSSREIDLLVTGLALVGFLPSEAEDISLFSSSLVKKDLFLPSGPKMSEDQWENYPQLPGFNGIATIDAKKTSKTYLEASTRRMCEVFE